MWTMVLTLTSLSLAWPLAITHYPLKATNADGVWSPHQLSIRINILAPWYQRWWAWTGYGLAVVAALWLFFRNRSRQLALKNEVELASLRQQELEKLKEMHVDQYLHRTRSGRSAYDS